MKAIKFIGFMLFCGMLCTHLYSCTNEEQTEPQTEDEWVEVALNISKQEVSVYDEPMSRAASSEVYHIVVRNETDDEVYAYGIFDDLTDLTIKVNKNKTYRFIHFMFDSYFDLYDFGSNYTTAGNKFIYTACPSDFQVPHLKGTDDSNMCELLTKETYSNMSEFKPSTETAYSVELKRVSSAIKIEAEGLDEGKIECVMGPVEECSWVGATLDDKITLELTSETTSAESIVTLVDFITTWGDKEDYYCSREILVVMNYIDEEGNSTQFYSEKCTFTINKRKCFKIKSNETEVGITITKENVTVEDEDTEEITYN